MNRASQLRLIERLVSRPRGLASRRQLTTRRPAIEGLEDRTLLSTINWSTTAAPTGGNWDTGSNWQEGVAPGPSDTAVIKGLTGSGIVYLNSNQSDSVFALTTDSTTTLKIISGSLALGAATSSTLGGPVSVSSGATLSVGASASVVIDSTVSDGGALNFANGDSVSIYANQITVNGTMSASDDTFSSAGYSPSIAVNSGGELTATNSTFSLSQLSLDNNSILTASDLSGDVFNMPIYLPYNDIRYLGNNSTFNDVNINYATLASGTLNLGQIGSAASLRYVFPNGFNIAAGATVDVGADIKVLADATIADNGALNFANGDSVSIYANQITVNGTMTASDDTFSSAGYSPSIAVNSGGELTATNSTFSLSQLSFDNNSILTASDLSGDVFNMPIYLPYNDIRYLGNNSTFNDVNINYATLASGTLNLGQIGSAASLRYVFPNGFNIAAGATVDVGADIKVLADATIADNGALNFANGDSVSIYANQITVNGTMTASDDTFSSAGYSPSIAVNSGGELTATNSTFSLSQLSFDNNSILTASDLSGDVFNMPIYLPYNDIRYLGNNSTFNDVNINYATLASGTLNLGQIGSAASLRYVFPNGFNIAAGATVNVGADIKVLADATIADNGAFNFANGDSISIYANQITVNGTMSASGASFSSAGYSPSITVNSGGELTTTNSSYGLSSLLINSGGQLIATGNTFAVSTLSLTSGSTDTMQSNVFNTQLAVNSGAFISITGNDFSNGTVVASGPSSATIDLRYNYWGTTDPTAIAAKITDRNDAPVNTRPLVLYTPFEDAPPATLGTIQGVVFNDLNGNGVQDRGS